MGEGMPQASIDIRISTTWVSGPRAIFWQTVLHPTRSPFMRGVAYVWLLDAHNIALHQSVNPLLMMFNTLRATDASVLYADVPITAAEASTAASTPTGLGFVHHSGRCAARTTRTARLSPYAFIRRDAWDVFHERALNRIVRDINGTGPYVALGLDELVCGLSATTFRDRPACVAASTPPIHLIDRAAVESDLLADVQRAPRYFVAAKAKGVAASTTKRRFTASAGCPPQSECAVALTKAFGTRVFSGKGKEAELVAPVNYTTSRSRLPLCWTVGGSQKEGLTLTRSSKALQNEQNANAKLAKQRFLETRGTRRGGGAAGAAAH